MFFVKIFRFFRQRKALMYMLLIVSMAVFAFFGLQIKLEEDMSKLLPLGDSNESGVVFTNLKVKDKVFIQMKGQSPEVMADYIDELMDSIMTCDSIISNTLYRLDADVALSALDYAMEHVPSFVDTSLYDKFDQAIADADATMQHNYEIIMDDETGSKTQMVATDPLNLRSLLMPSIGGGMGFTIIDNHLFSRDSTVALAFLSPRFLSFDSKQSTVLVEHIEKSISEFNVTHPDVEILFHGTPVRSSGNSKKMHKDIFLTIGIALVIILILLCVSFRSAKIIIHNVLPIAYGTFFALACMYWIKGGMSLIALGVGVLILGVAISYCLHIIIHQYFVCDVEKMLKDEAKPVILGCLTTIGAFLGLLFTKSDLLKDFGLFSTLLLLGSTFFSLVFLPQFLSSKEANFNKFIFKIVDKANNYSYDRNYIMVGLLTVVIIIGIVFTPKVKFDNDLKNIGYLSDELLKSEKLYAEKNTNGLLQRYYAVVAPSLDEALDYNETLANALDSLHKAGVIKNYTPIVSKLFQSEKEQNMRIEAWHNYWTPEKIDEAMSAVNKAATDNELDPEMFDLFRSMLEAEYEPGNLYEEGILPEGLVCNFIEESGDDFIIFNATQIDSVRMDDIDDHVARLSHSVVVDPYYYTGKIRFQCHFTYLLTVCSAGSSGIFPQCHCGSVGIHANVPELVCGSGLDGHFRIAVQPYQYHYLDVHLRHRCRLQYFRCAGSSSRGDRTRQPVAGLSQGGHFLLGIGAAGGDGSHVFRYTPLNIVDRCKHFDRNDINNINNIHFATACLQAVAEMELF